MQRNKNSWKIQLKTSFPSGAINYFLFRRSVGYHKTFSINTLNLIKIDSYIGSWNVKIYIYKAT